MPGHVCGASPIILWALTFFDPAILLPVLEWSIAEWVPVNLPFYHLQPSPVTIECIHRPGKQMLGLHTPPHCTPPQLAHNCYDFSLLLRGSKFWCLLLLTPHEHSATLPTDSSAALSCMLLCQTSFGSQRFGFWHMLWPGLCQVWQVIHLHLSLQPRGASEHRRGKAI